MQAELAVGFLSYRARLVDSHGCVCRGWSAAGVWRRTAMEQAGGWNMDSTVEDMDLSLRAYLNGWKFK